MMTYARRGDPRTSKRAASTLAPILRMQIPKIYSALRDVYPSGLTAHEIAARAKMPYTAVQKRLKPGLLGRFAALTGEERLGPYGKPCRVWKAIVR